MSQINEIPILFSFPPLQFEDEEKYPEFYRKTDYIKGSNVEVPQPFRVGRIMDIHVRKTDTDTIDPEKVTLRIRKFYRCEGG